MPPGFSGLELMKSIKTFRYFFLFGIFLLTAWFAPSTVFADEVSEYRLKAAFIQKFAKFIDWPKDAFSSPSSPIKIGVLGDTPMSEEISLIAGRYVAGRKLEVIRDYDLDEDGSVHILFIGESESRSYRKNFKRLGNQPVLTIGESRKFCLQGGVINLFLAQNKMRFEINQGQAEKLGLNISSKLLRLARTVYNK